MAERLLGLFLFQTDNTFFLFVAAMCAVVVSVLGAAGLLLYMAVSHLRDEVDSVQKQLRFEQRRVAAMENALIGKGIVSPY